MAEREFFLPSFIGQIISFSDPDSRWRLTCKLREKYSQLTYNDTLIWPNKPGEAYGTFLCTNCDDASHEAVMRIVMQIPFAGSEYAGPQDRARQGVQALPRQAQDMLDALDLLRQRNSGSGPRLLGVAHPTHLDENLVSVPRGFFMCLLLENLPGQQLGPWFWDLDRGTRDRIRACFKNAWIECSQITEYGFIPTMTKLFWDERTSRISFYDFCSGLKRDYDEDGDWNDIQWCAWRFVKKPPGLTRVPTEEDLLTMKSWR